MALQYSNFDSRSASKSRSIMVTPIHETPLGGSDSELSTLNDNPLSDDCLTDDPYNNPTHSTGRNTALRVVNTDPLRSRLKDELEGSDNVSTSNDELIISESDVYDNNLWAESQDPLLRSIQMAQSGSLSNVNTDSIFGSRKSSVDSRLAAVVRGEMSAQPNFRGSLTVSVLTSVLYCLTSKQLHILKFHILIFIFLF